MYTLVTGGEFICDPKIQCIVMLTIWVLGSKIFQTITPFYTIIKAKNNKCTRKVEEII